MRKFGVGLLTFLAAGFVVGMAPAGATDVSTEAELRTAFDTDSQIDLLNDITLTDCQEGDLNRSSADAVTLDGHGFTITQTCPDNILEPGSDLTVQNVTLTGGREPDDGGAIDMNGGDLNVLDSRLTGNCAADSAGAIENEDNTTVIRNSTLDDNAAEDQGGAIRSKRGEINISNSTITGNRQAVAGAVDSGQRDDVGTSLVLVHATIVENEVDAGITCNTGLPVSETEAGDAEPEGLPAVANVHAVDAFTSFGTVVALPVGAVNCFVDDATSLGFNYSDDDTCGFTDATDTENGDDPLLGALADNGGPTPTRLPQTGSPLIDAIPTADCGAEETDQRGVLRPQGEACEIGAVEVEAVEEPPPPPPAQPVATTPAFTG